MTWKFKQIEPQLARGTLTDDLWEDPNWVAEEKYDGDRRIAQFCGDVVRFTGRRKSVKNGLFVEKTENVPHLSGAWRNESCVPKLGGPFVVPPRSLDGTVLDGEMIFTVSEAARAYGIDCGGLSKYVTSIMGSDPEEAIRKQIDRGWLRYVVFDCLFYKGEDVRKLPLMDRKELVAKAVHEWGNPFAYAVSYAMVVKRRMYEDIVRHGGEGVILKHVGATYGANNTWVKVKKTFTADVVITGFEMAKEVSKKKSGEVSKTKFAGMVGAVSISQWKRNERGEGYLSPVSKKGRGVSGMDDATRRDITDHPKKYLGKVLRIEHNGREPSGCFRHPRWDSLRTDKSPKECVFDMEEK